MNTLPMHTDRWFSFFDIAARGYDLLTHQDLWREQIARAVDLAWPRSLAPRVLDLGCGPGLSAFVLAQRLGPEAEVIGIDSAEQMVTLARRHHQSAYAHLDNVRFEQIDATKMPFADGHFDLIVGHSVLYLVPDRIGVLREARRVLAPGGKLVLMEPRAGGSLRAAIRHALPYLDELRHRPIPTIRFALSMVTWRIMSRLVGRMSPDRVERLFREAGFKEIDFRSTLGGLGLHCIGTG